MLVTFVGAAAICSCGGRSSVIAPIGDFRPLNASAAVAVAGDTPGQFAANLAVARAQQKNVRFVSISTAAGTDNYSVYSPVMRSRDAVVVIAYGRLHAYPIVHATIAYSGYPDPIKPSSLPRVKMPTLNALIKDGNSNGRTAAQLVRLCGHCSVVLMRRPGAPVTANLWNSKKDPWQVNPDYIFWAPGTEVIASNSRRPEFVNQPCDASGYLCCDPYIEYCFPSFPSFSFPSEGGGSAPPPPPPPSPCDRTLNQSKARKPASTRSGLTTAKLAALAQTVAKNSVPDAEIEQNIDQQVQGERRAYVRKVMLELPPTARQNVSGIDESGHFFSNRQADFVAMDHSKPWRHLRNNVWINPSGETVALPTESQAELTAESAARRTSSSAPCPAPGGENSGEYVRAYVCNSTSRSFTSVVDASQVGGPFNANVCMPELTPPQIKEPDTGYLYVGGWSNGGTTPAEGGLQWSPTFHNYAMYAFDKAAVVPDQIPNTNSFPWSVFTITFATTPTFWTITVTSSGGATHSWVHNGVGPQGPVGPITSGTLWTYKQATSIAQDLFNPSDGSYFGVDSTGAPVFAWLPQGLACCDQYPDVTHALRVGNLYGINNYII
jgi:hypothetical protein